MGTDDPTLPSKPKSKNNQRLALTTVVAEQICIEAGVSEDAVEVRAKVLDIVQKVYASGVAAGREEEGSGSHARWRGQNKEIEELAERYDWMVAAHGVLLEVYGAHWFASGDEVVYSEDQECLVKYRNIHFGREPNDGPFGVGQECYSIDEVLTVTRTPYGVVVVVSAGGGVAIFRTDKELAPVGA